MQGALLGDVYPAPQFLLQIRDQPARKPGWRARPGVNQQIEVAIRARVPPGKGPEDAHAHNAMPACNGENRRALIRPQFIDGHALLFSHHLDLTERFRRDEINAGFVARAPRLEVHAENARPILRMNSGE